MRWQGIVLFVHPRVFACLSNDLERLLHKVLNYFIRVEFFKGQTFCVLFQKEYLATNVEHEHFICFHIITTSAMTSDRM